MEPTSLASARPGAADQRVRLHGATWADYERLLAIRGDKSVPRMTYLRGELELMTPTIDHEAIARTISRLLWAYAEERGLELQDYGSWTIKMEARERGAEPDACFVVGTHRPRVPDFVVEVIWTSGGIDKLAVYRELGVKEVWFWADGRLAVLRASGKRWVKRRRSAVLPELDLELLTRVLDARNQTRAVRELRAALRRRR